MTKDMTLQETAYQQKNSNRPGKLSAAWNLLKNHPLSAITAGLVWLAALLTMAVLIFLVGFIVIKGVRHLTPSLFSFTYNSENVSLMPALLNTLIITAKIGRAHV